MKGASELSIGLIIVLLIGLVILLIVIGSLTESSNIVKDVGNQNTLYSCCMKWLPDCSSDPTALKCNPDTTLRQMGDAVIGVTGNLREFCGC